MSSARTDRFREELKKLRIHAVLEIELTQRGGFDALYEHIKVALDEDCYTFLQGTHLFCKKLRPVDDTGYPGVAFAIPAYGDPKVFDSSAGSSPGIGDPRNDACVLWDRSSPRDVIDYAVAHSSKEFIVFTHHDVYIPKNWGPRMWRAFQDAERRFGPTGVVGVFGVSGDRRVQRIEAGAVLDQGGRRTLVGQPPLPQAVRVLDGCAMMFRRDSGILPDPELGWHFYDADMCLQAGEKNLKVVAVENWLLHRSEWQAPDEKFKLSEEIFRRKWARALPVEVPCTLVS